MCKNQSNKKKIIIISVAENWGGGEEFILELCKSISNYEFIILSAKGTAANLFSEKGLSVNEISSLKKIERSAGAWNILAIVNIIFNLFINCPLLLIKFMQFKPALIVLNGNMAGLYSLIPALLTRKKFIVVQHLIYNQPSFEIKILRTLIRYAAKFVCVSKAVAEELTKYINNLDCKSKIQVIYNGINLSEIHIKNISAAYEKIRLGYVGSLKKEKGIEMLLEALELIPPTLDYLLIIYSDTSDTAGKKYYERTKKLITSKNLQNRVLIRDFTIDKNKLYEELDILINYSAVAESFSYVVVEGLSRGKIVIASNEGGPKEIIANGYNGFLVEPRNPPLLAETISNCLKNFDSSGFESIRINAVNTVNNKFSIEQFKENYEKLFNSIIN